METEEQVTKQAEEVIFRMIEVTPYIAVATEKAIRLLADELVKIACSPELARLAAMLSAQPAEMESSEDYLERKREALLEQQAIAHRSRVKPWEDKRRSFR